MSELYTEVNDNGMPNEYFTSKQMLNSSLNLESSLDIYKAELENYVPNDQPSERLDIMLFQAIGPAISEFSLFDDLYNLAVEPPGSKIENINQLLGRVIELKGSYQTLINQYSNFSNEELLDFPEDPIVVFFALLENARGDQLSNNPHPSVVSYTDR